MSDALSDHEVVRAIVRGQLLSADQLWALLDEPHDRPLLQVLVDRGIVEEAMLLDFLPTLARTRTAAPAPSAPPVRPEPEPSGRPRVGKFELLEKLGQGGMGEVWKAWQTDLARTVALKLLVKVGQAELARFRREAKLSASLSHPNIASVYEFGEVFGRPYIVMELIRGQTLAGARLPPRRLLAVMRDVADAIHYAHGKGIIHRDLKPQNLMLDTHGKAYVMDFGLARASHGSESTTLTAEGAIMGTPSYMAPEQVRGMSRQIGPRTDVWSLGATLYQILTGVPPFPALSNSDLFIRILRDDPLGPRRLVPHLDRDVETIVLRCLEKDPDRRYATAGDLAEDLGRSIRGEPILARRAGVVERVVRKLARHPLALTAIGLLALLSMPLLLLCKAGPDPADLLRAQARRLERTGQPAQALAAYEELKLLDPRDRELTPLERAAREAAQDRERARDAADLVDLGRRLKSRSRDHALALFGMAAGVEPRNRDARQELSELLPPGPASQHLRDPKEGEARLDLTLDPPDARVRFIPEARLPILAPGSYVLKATSPGHAEATMAVLLADESRGAIDLRLPPGNAPYGYVFVPDGKRGGSFISPFRVGRSELDAFLFAHGRPPKGDETVTREDAAAYAGWKGARLPTDLELKRVEPLWRTGVDGDPVRSEWAAESASDERRCFRLVRDLP
ncbi:MAG TPA: serine/threonine-protein kinase [Planctomycetota bacterium]